MNRSYYAIFPINPDSSREQIKKTFYWLSRNVHPDKKNSIYGYRMQQLNNVYDILYRKGADCEYFYNIFGDGFLKYLENITYSDIFITLFSKLSIQLIFFGTLLLALNIIIFPFLIHLYHKKTIKYFSLTIIPTYLSILLFFIFGFTSYRSLYLNKFIEKNNDFYILKSENMRHLCNTLILCLIQIFILSICIDKKVKNLNSLYLLPCFLNQIYNSVSIFIYQKKIFELYEKKMIFNILDFKYNLIGFGILFCNIITKGLLKCYILIILMIFSLSAFNLAVRWVLDLILFGLFTGSRRVWKEKAKRWAYIGYIFVFILLNYLMFVTIEYNGVEYIFYIIFGRIMRRLFLKKPRFLINPGNLQINNF